MNVSVGISSKVHKSFGHILYVFRRTKVTCHPYTHRKLTSYELADELAKDIIYNKNGLVVLNKPQGISFSEEPPKNNNEFEISLHTLLPYLKEKLNYKYLMSAKVPEKYGSGVAVFCTTEKVHKRVHKSFKAMRAQYIPAESYECVVIGQPARDVGKHDGSIALVTSPNGNQKGIKLTEEYSKSMVRNGKAKTLRIEHETLLKGALASRLRLSITRTKWHGLRVYAATHLLSPVLGDRVFGPLVKSILGKTILVDMWSPAASQNSKLPAEFLKKLELDSREDLEIPLHLHLSKVMLQNFPIKGRNLEFIAKPPDFYEWTCSKLNLCEESSIMSLYNSPVACNSFNLFIPN